MGFAGHAPSQEDHIIDRLRAERDALREMLEEFIELTELRFGKVATQASLLGRARATLSGKGKA
jgi:hypothetical protein